MRQKLVSDLFIILVNNPKQPLHARNSFKSKIFWKRIIEKPYLKRITLFFLLNPVPFNIQNYQKQKGPETSDQLLFSLRNKFNKIPLLVMYYLTMFDDVIWSGFWVFLLKIHLSYAKDAIALHSSIHKLEYSTHDD